MKKIFLVLAMVFILAGVAIPCEVPAQTATATATATGGTATGGSATIQKGAVQNSNSNLNVNTNVFDPTSINIQGQIQGQSQNNKQTIAPVQETIITTPQELLALPSQYVPSLNFGSGRMKDVTATMPNFAIYGIAKYAGEPILDVLNVNANVKFKNYFKAILNDAKDIASAKNFKASEVRIIVVCAEAQKTWTTGGNIGGGGSALASGGLGGISAVGSIIPQFGGTKSDDLFTILFVKVSL